MIRWLSLTTLVRVFLLSTLSIGVIALMVPFSDGVKVTDAIQTLCLVFAFIGVVFQLERERTSTNARFFSEINANLMESSEYRAVFEWLDRCSRGSDQAWPEPETADIIAYINFFSLMKIALDRGIYVQVWPK